MLILILSPADVDLGVSIEGLSVATLKARYAFLQPLVHSAPAMDQWPLIQVRRSLPIGLRDALKVLRGDDEIQCAHGGKRRLYFNDGCHVYDPLEITAEVMQHHARAGAAVNAAIVRAFALRGGIVVHGLAFEYAGKGCLALGDSGAGKSTLATAILLAGGRIVSDDLVLLGGALDGGVRALSFRADMVLRDRSYRRFRLGLRQRGVDLVELQVDGERKWRIPRDRHPGCFTQATSVAAVMLLVEPGGEGGSEVGLVTQAEGYAAIVRDNYFFNSPHPLEQGAMSRTLGGLLAEVPVLKVAPAGRLLSRPVEEVDDLLRRVGKHACQHHLHL